MNLFTLLNPIILIRYFIKHKSLIMQFSKREILSRYKGSFFGVFWTIMNPVLLLIVYTFVFSVVFKARWGTTTDGANQFEFALIIFSGMIVYSIFNETVNRAPQLITSNVNYVKKVIFPLEILPITVLISSFVHAGVSFVALIIALNIFVASSNIALLFSIIVIVPLLFITLGIAWIISSLGVYIRDIGYTVSFVTTVLFYLTPIFYPISVVPNSFEKYMRINPLTTIVEDFRNAVIWGQFPDWLTIIGFYIGSYLFMVLGLIWFLKTRKGFADVL